MNGEPVDLERFDGDYDDSAWRSCDGCTCCSAAACHRGSDSDCPVGGEGTYWEGESTCPCTGG